MTPRERRLQVDLAACRYLEALEQGDHDTLAELWRRAEGEPDLEAALHELHAGLLEERQQAEVDRAAVTVTAAVETHLPSARVVRPESRPVTVADVAAELFRQPPGRLPAEAHRLTETLLTAAEPLPAELALSKLIAWAEARFGPAPPEYWKAFRQAAIQLELARASAVEYQQAARATPRKPEDPRR